MFGYRDARVRLEARLEGPGSDRKLSANRVRKIAKRFRCEESWGAASEMHLAKRARRQFRHGRDVHRQFGDHAIDVGTLAAVIARDDRVAAAERAERFAEGQMHIQGKRG